MQPEPKYDDEIRSRQRWMGVLARASEAELEAAWGSCPGAAGNGNGDAGGETGGAPEFALLRRPETGMALVRGRMGGTGRAFNLGEMTMTRCAVRLGGIVGYAYVAGRGERRAELAARFDALLQDPARREPLLREVVGPLERRQAEQRRKRAAKSGATRVEFFTMVRGEHA